MFTYVFNYDAIRDGNVLGFSVEYISTFANAIHDMDESYVSSIDENELWMADDRLNMIAKHLRPIIIKRRVIKCTRLS